MTYFLQFCDASDQRLKATCAEKIKSDSPIPVIPSVGDTVMREQRLLMVVHRLIIYSDDDTTVLCFCRESDEDHIRASCGQSVDLSESDS